jgi:ABC-type Fe3+ transport system permease subunit
MLLMFLPRALISLRAGIAQAPVELEQAARSLGRTPAQALWAITMRLAAPSAAAGAALVGLGITNELTATLMLAPNGTRTLAIVLGLQQRDRLRRRRALCAHHGAALAAHDLAALPTIQTHGGTMTR